ncbi:ABC transporter permease [Falsiroseomonas sp. HC035]|uniref:ABC transporter permease n=1 Tax=Falsiroseomonas sp. HC035 TaxID=3390999 RepID=UPI003D314269
MTPPIGPVALRWIVLGAILLLWEAAPRLGWVPPVILATPSATLLAGLADPGTFARALLFTLTEIAAALGLAYGLGGLAGVVIGTSPLLRQALLPLVSSVYAIPFVVIYPVMTAWLGIGPSSKIWFAGFYGFFPVLLSVAAGVQLVDRNLVLMARSAGASPRQMALEVLLPAALPAIISGLRIGGALTTIGVVVAEMLAATDGIGFLITQNRTMFRTPEVYFGILLVLLLAGTLDTAIGRLERRTARWRPLREGEMRHD